MSLQITYLPIGELTPYLKNPRKNDKAVDIVARSINRKFYKVLVFNVTMPMIKFCEICGKQFKVKPSQYERLKCCSKVCYGKRRSKLFVGKNAPNWKDGTELSTKGWKWVYCPEHPKAHRNKVAEHRLVMEKKLGRLLTSQDMVHHINENKTDNRPENLELMTRSSHASLHHPKGKKIGEK